MPSSLDPTAIDRLLQIGGPDLLRRMIEAYLGTSPERLTAALEGYASGDLQAVERAAHSLKSSSANFGAEDLVDLVATIEQRATEGEARALEPLMEELPGRFEAVCRSLEDLDRELAS
jgi:two-component system sensor histidine kinase BarA